MLKVNHCKCKFFILIYLLIVARGGTPKPLRGFSPWDLLTQTLVPYCSLQETTAEGVWGKLHSKSIEQYCRGGIGEEGFTLLSTPLKTYLTQRRDITADAHQVSLLPFNQVTE